MNARVRSALAALVFVSATTGAARAQDIAAEIAFERQQATPEVVGGLAALIAGNVICPRFLPYSVPEEAVAGYLTQALPMIGGDVDSAVWRGEPAIERKWRAAPAGKQVAWCHRLGDLASGLGL